MLHHKRHTQVRVKVMAKRCHDTTRSRLRPFGVSLRLLICSILIACIGIAWVISGWTYASFWPASVSKYKCGFNFGAGVIEIGMYESELPDGEEWGHILWKNNVRYLHKNWERRFFWWFELAFEFSPRDGSPYWKARIPLWALVCPILVAIGLEIAAYFRRRSRIAATRCVGCGYDVASAATDPCPECGCVEHMACR